MTSSLPRILVIDDDKDCLQNLVAMLQEIGYSNVTSRFFSADSFRACDFSVSTYLPPLHEGMIIFLDEKMSTELSTCSGSDLRNYILQQSIHSKSLTFVSTTDGDSPAWAEHHYTGKTDLPNEGGQNKLISLLSKI